MSAMAIFGKLKQVSAGGNVVNYRRARAVFSGAHSSDRRHIQGRSHGFSPPPQSPRSGAFIHKYRSVDVAAVYTSDAWADERRYNHGRPLVVLTLASRSRCYAIHKIHTRSSPFIVMYRSICVGETATIVVYRNMGLLCCMRNAL